MDPRHRAVPERELLRHASCGARLLLARGDGLARWRSQGRPARRRDHREGDVPAARGALPRAQRAPASRADAVDGHGPRCLAQRGRLVLGFLRPQPEESRSAGAAGARSRRLPVPVPRLGLRQLLRPLPRLGRQHVDVHHHRERRGLPRRPDRVRGRRLVAERSRRTRPDDASREPAERVRRRRGDRVYGGGAGVREPRVARALRPASVRRARPGSVPSAGDDRSRARRRAPGVRDLGPVHALPLATRARSARTWSSKEWTSRRTPSGAGR